MVGMETSDEEDKNRLKDKLVVDRGICTSKTGATKQSKTGTQQETATHRVRVGTYQ